MFLVTGCWCCACGFECGLMLLRICLGFDFVGCVLQVLGYLILFLDVR